MLLRVDSTLPLPVYEQVRAQIARLAAGGQVPAGTRLPTIRQLAADLGVAKGTVERAYLLLESDGYIETRGRAGTFLRRPATTAPSTAATVLADAATSLGVTAVQLGATDDEVLAAVRVALHELRAVGGSSAGVDPT